VLVAGKGPDEDRIAQPLTQSSPPGKEVGRPRERRDRERRTWERRRMGRRGWGFSAAVRPRPSARTMLGSSAASRWPRPRRFCSPPALGPRGPGGRRAAEELERRRGAREGRGRRDGVVRGERGGVTAPIRGGFGMRVYGGGGELGPRAGQKGRVGRGGSRCA